MTWDIFISIVSGNGLLPNGTKPLPGPMLIYCQIGPCGTNSATWVKRIIFIQENASQNTIMWPLYTVLNVLTHWGRLTHICVDNLTISGSDNGLSPGRCPAIIWPNAGILVTGSLGTNLSEILIAILIFSFKKMHWKMSAMLSRPQCVKRKYAML